MGDLDAPTLAVAGPETPILDVLVMLSRARRRIAVFTLIALALGASVAFALKPTYTASATILPPQAPQSSVSSLMGQLGSLSPLAGSSGGLLKNPADIYIGILQSRTLTDLVIEKFSLQNLWNLKLRDDARKRLHTMAQFESSKDGLIQITVKDPDPRRASEIANFFLEALYGMNSHLAITEASQRRLFFDQQLAEEKNALVAAEEDLKTTQLKTGLISLSGQTDLAVRSIAQNRAQIASKEVELQGMRTYASDENPDVILAQRQLAALRSQLATLENNQASLSPGDTQVAANQVPAGSLEYVRKLREVRYHDTLLDLLSRQYEAARIDEAKSAPIIQVVDRAVPPDKKSAPSRLLILLGAGSFGFVLGCGEVLLRNAILRARQAPQVAEKLDQLLGSSS